MTLQRKKTAVCAGLVLLCAWPPLHMVLALGWGTDPWSLFGWGMYTTPKPVVQVDLGEIGPAGTERPWPTGVREAAERYRDRRRVFGALVPPDGLAATALAARPELAGVAIRLRRLVLDPSSARFVVQEELFRYPRGGRGR